MQNIKIRKDFPILNEKVNGKPLIYFDNSATSQKPKVVIDKLAEYYTKTNANIHRGIHHLSEKATREFEESKRKVADFINAKSEKEIIYTKNTTESINLVAYALAFEYFKKGDLIVSTEMEHHSNIVPWQYLSKKLGLKLKFIRVKGDYTLDLDHYKTILKQNPKLVTFTHTSNVIGTINPVSKMTKMAHKVGALVLIDGAQSVPHMRIDVKAINCDFYAFSSHKMCGPTGIGVLYGKEEILNNMPPFLCGGDMIKEVNFDNFTCNNLPWKFEAGTPNIADGIALGTAIDYLNKIGMENIKTHNQEITSYALSKLQEFDNIRIFGQNNSVEERGSMIAFNLTSKTNPNLNIHPHDIAHLLNNNGIAIRSGNHCAQPLHKIFNLQATARASFYFYNTKEEVDVFIDSLKNIIKLFS